MHKYYMLKIQFKMVKYQNHACYFKKVQRDEKPRRLKNNFVSFVITKISLDIHKRTNLENQNRKGENVFIK